MVEHVLRTGGVSVSGHQHAESWTPGSGDSGGAGRPSRPPICAAGNRSSGPPMRCRRPSRCWGDGPARSASLRAMSAPERGNLAHAARDASRRRRSATVVTALVERPYVRPNHPDRRADRPHRRRTRRFAGTAASREINSGIYALDMAPLFAAVARHRRAKCPGRVLPHGLVTVYRRRKLRSKP